MKNLFNALLIAAIVITGLVFYFTKQPAPWIAFLICLGLLLISRIEVLILAHKANKRTKILNTLKDILNIIKEPEGKQPKPKVFYEDRTVAALLEMGQDKNYAITSRVTFLMTARRLIGDNSLDGEILKLTEGVK